MCVFEQSKVEWNRNIPEDEAILAYKWLIPPAMWRYTYISPFQRDNWRDNKLSANLTIIPFLGTIPAGYGIYAWASLRGARAMPTRSNAVIVRVKLWGNVVRFRYRLPNRREIFNLPVPTGYMATEALIVNEV